MSQHTLNILAVSGSLRSNSSNNAVIDLIATLLPAHVQLTIYGGLGSLPPFDDSRQAYEAVTDWRAQLAAADGVLICSPEYAFGVPGALKNALDWTVSSGELVQKPLALITAATGGDKAHAALLLTFSALSANIPERNTLLLSFIRSKMNEQNQVTDADTITEIRAILASLIKVIETARNEAL